MEALHKQTLPFLLRRMKEDVLQDLPPKIIQDYYCELSPLQVNSFVDVVSRSNEFFYCLPRFSNDSFVFTSDSYEMNFT